MNQPWFDRDPEAYEAVRRLLLKKYPTLHLRKVNGEAVVTGTLALYDNGVEFDRYSLEIKLPSDYPASIATVYETADRIPREMDRHTYPTTGALCLGVTEELWLTLKGDFSIGTLLDIPIRNFLIGNCHIEEGLPWPSGDRSHGSKGVLEFYREYLSIHDEAKLVRFLYDIVLNKHRGHWPCPCGSGLILRKCHMDAARKLNQLPKGLICHSAEGLWDRVKQSRGVGAAA